MVALNDILAWSRRWEVWYRRALPAYWVFLFCVTHFPNLRLDLPLPETDLWAHFVAFGLLGFLFWRFVESYQRPVSARLFQAALPGLVVYAAFDEYLQQFVGRSTAFTDWLADVAGLAVVLIALEYLRRRALRRPAAGEPRGSE